MMKRLMAIAALLALAGAAFAGDYTRRVTQTLDHSAFFNGAGYQDEIPVRVTPVSRTVVTHPDHDRHPRPPHWHSHHRAWWTPVQSYWVPGHYEWTVQSVWIEPTWTTEYVPPVYRYAYQGSRQIQILVRDGYYRRVQIPGHYEQRQVQVWVDGCWRYY